MDIKLSLKTMLVSLALLLISVIANAQELKLLEFRADMTMIDAIRFPKEDLNGDRCGLIKLGLALPKSDVEFEGDIISSENKSGEWWIYLPQGSNWLTIKSKSNSYLPFRCDFADYGIDGIVSNVTYVMNVKKLESDPKPHWMLLANYGYAHVRQSSLGFTLAWAGRFGGYLSFMTNGSFDFSTNLSATMDEQQDYLWSGKTAKTRMAVTVGGLFAVKKLGYVYAGAGYGIRNLIWYTESGQSVAMTPGSYKGVALETGMLFNIGSHALISAGGLVQFPGPYYEMKLGIGYKF